MVRRWMRTVQARSSSPVIASTNTLLSKPRYFNIAGASVGQVIVNNTLVSASTDMQGIAVYGVGLYPLSKKADIYINLGVVDWDADVRVNNMTSQSDGTYVLYGVGAADAFTRNVAVFAEWDGFNSDNPELSMLAFGFRFSF